MSNSSTWDFNLNTVPEPAKRRDFLYIATGTVAAAATAGAVWPLISSLGPSAETRASGADVIIDLSDIEVGQRVTVVWRNKPIFIDRRSPAQIRNARTDDKAKLLDPELDQERVQRSEWLVVVGLCTHLGCIPLGQKNGDQKGRWGGWYCPCHGSQYDASGRVRKGPAPKNLEVPPYEFLMDTSLKIG